MAAQWPSGPLIACPRSKEKVCVQHAAPIERSCDWVPADAPLAPTPIIWSRVAFGIATYNAPHEAALLQAAAGTWLRMVSGAALLLTTDRDDPRSDAEVAPFGGSGVGSELAVEVVVHRCARCCGDASRRCNGGVAEGWKARTKVADMFAEMARRWGGGGGDGGNAANGAARDWFVKLDADSTMVPHNLGALLGELLWLVGAVQPLLLGLAACRSNGALARLCHAAGGAGCARGERRGGGRGQGLESMGLGG